MADQQKMQRIAATIEKLEKDFGKGTVVRYGDAPSIELETVSSGSLSLDAALGVGGYPKGRIIEVYGPESSGKTTLCLHAAAEVQRQGGVVGIVDAEHALDFEYAKALGVDVENILLSQPDYGEQALEVTRRLSVAGVDLLIVDSVAALVPKSELEGEIGDSSVGKQARMMSQALRVMAGEVSRANSIVMFTNQIREKIGVMFGSPETTPGGNALKFFASVRLDIRRLAQVKDKDSEEPVANKVKVKVIKNKVAPPFRTAEFEIRYGVGIDKAKELLNVAVDGNVVQKSGSWYSFEGNRLGQGEDAVTQLLRDNPELQGAIAGKLSELLNAA